jgi:hypothetical protein
MRRLHEDEREARVRDEAGAVTAPVSQAARMLALQRTVGNHAVAAMLAREAKPKQVKPALGLAILGGIGTVPLLSATLAERQAGGSREKPTSSQEVFLTSEMGDHSADLQLAAQSAAVFDAEVMLGEKLRLKLHKAMISSFSMSDAPGGDSPVETWTLNAESIEIIADDR